MNRTHLAWIPVLAAALCLIASTATAQSVWLPQTDGTRLSLEIMRPQQDARCMAMGYETSGITSGSLIWCMSAQIKISDHLSLLGDLPYASLSRDLDCYIYEYGWYRPSNERQSTIGNPLVGIRLTSNDHSWWGQATVRIPSVESRYDDVAEYAATGDYPRFEAYLNHVMAYDLRIGTRFSPTGSSGAECYGGITYLAVYDDAYYGPITEQLFREPRLFRMDGRDQIYFNYGLIYRLRSSNLVSSLGLTGRFQLTDETSYWEPNETRQGPSIHLFDVAAYYKLGDVWPGIHLLVPADSDLQNLADVNYTLGLSLSVVVEPEGR